MRRYLATSLSIMFMMGCAVGPNYRHPEMALPGQWSLAPSTQPVGNASQPAATTQPVNLASWWESLHDPMLNDLIRRGSESNLNLRIATARVVEARALRDIAVADYWPQINMSDSYSYTGSSLNASRPQRTTSPKLQALTRQIPTLRYSPASTDAATGVTTPASLQFLKRGSSTSTTSTGTRTHVIRDSHLFQEGFDASWELDVFGRIRRSVEATTADLQALEEDRRNVLVTLLSDVALNYVQLRGYQRRLAIAEINIVDQQEVVDLTEERARAGFETELAVQQSRALLESTRSQVPAFTSAIRQSIYTLGVLIGEPPEALLEELTAHAPLPTTPPQIPMGLPSDLLRRRPDIRSAERAYAAATARVGVATADLFPTFALTGSFGTQSYDFRHILDRNSIGWSLGPNVSWPIFQGGRIRANIRAENARQEEALLNYAQTVLAALQEVESTLVAYNTEKVRYETLGRAAHANEEAVALAKKLVGGFTTFLDLIDSLRSLYSSQDQMIQSETTTVTNLISLYKALGGGWDPDFEPQPVEPQRHEEAKE